MFGFKKLQRRIDYLHTLHDRLEDDITKLEGKIGTLKQQISNSVADSERFRKLETRASRAEQKVADLTRTVEDMIKSKEQLHGKRKR